MVVEQGELLVLMAAAAAAAAALVAAVVMVATGEVAVLEVGVVEEQKDNLMAMVGLEQQVRCMYYLPNLFMLDFPVDKEEAGAEPEPLQMPLAELVALLHLFPMSVVKQEWEMVSEVMVLPEQMETI
tara:strand:- start:87 stop:467 length:381 start_codon:yes stop_codon:yes gene_type:complete